MSRVSKHNYYLDIAQTVAERCTCLRKKFGAIIVKDDVIVLRDTMARREDVRIAVTLIFV